MSLLGIVSDWTTDFINHYEVHFKSLSDSEILNSVSNHIKKYEPEENIIKEVKTVGESSILENSIWYLLNWTFENISYNRKQSLKTLSDWCCQYTDSDSFKSRIDSYFIFTETTFILQHIAENPHDFDKWFEVLSPNNQFLNTNELRRLRDSMSRFLESYRNNIGLNFISGIVRLPLNEFEDIDGKDRFETSMVSIKEKFQSDQQEIILSELVRIGDELNEQQKEMLCFSIIKFYPERLEFLADHFNLPYLLNDVYTQKIAELRKLNIRLYEQLTEI